MEKNMEELNVYSVVFYLNNEQKLIQTKEIAIPQNEEFTLNKLFQELKTPKTQTVILGVLKIKKGGI
jgi:ABC-type thiamine transport system substrate-binding protein